MILSKKLLESIVERARYFPGEETAWKDVFFGILDCFGTENQEIEEIVSFERNKVYPLFVVRSLLGFLSYIHGRNLFGKIVPQKIVGELYFDYLEQLCKISAMVLPAFILLSDKDLVYLEPEDVVQLSDTYPVWARQVAEFTVHWEQAAGEMLRRIAADFRDSHITELYSMGSDQHNYGRRVFCIEMDGCRKWLYKPRSLATDLGWKDLCIWFRKESGIDIPYISVSDHGMYGYAEYIHYQSPAEEDIPLFFYHAGILLCLVYWTKGSDMHYENIVAHGVWPYPVDLEMITGDEKQFSVISTAMLKYEKKRDGEKTLDFGAFTNTDPQWLSLPRRAEKVITASEYREELIRGFLESYRILIKTKHRKTDFFRYSSPRYLFHSTSYYSALLSRLSLDDTLADGEKYYRTVKESLQCSGEDGKVFDSELRAILRGDIPFFYHKSRSRDLYDIDGIVEQDFFAHIPGHALQRKLSEEDMQVQADLIREGLP